MNSMRQKHIIHNVETFDVRCETLIMGNDESEVSIQGSCIVIGNETMQSRDAKVITLQKKVTILENQVQELQKQVNDMETYFKFQEEQK